MFYPKIGPGRTSMQSVPRSMRMGAVAVAHRGYSVPSVVTCCNCGPVLYTNPQMGIPAPGSASGVLAYACANAVAPCGIAQCAQAMSTPQLFAQTCGSPCVSAYGGPYCGACCGACCGAYCGACCGACCGAYCGAGMSEACSAALWVGGGALALYLFSKIARS